MEKFRDDIHRIDISKDWPHESVYRYFERVQRDTTNTRKLDE